MKRRAAAPRSGPRPYRPVCAPAQTVDEAVADLVRDMKHQVHLHRDLDACRAWKASPPDHFARARHQLDELAALLGALDEPHLDALRARRIRRTAANCANYLAFLAAHARRRRR